MVVNYCLYLDLSQCLTADWQVILCGWVKGISAVFSYIVLASILVLVILVNAKNPHFMSEKTMTFPFLFLNWVSDVFPWNSDAPNSLPSFMWSVSYIYVILFGIYISVLNRSLTQFWAFSNESKESSYALHLIWCLFWLSSSKFSCGLQCHGLWPNSEAPCILRVIVEWFGGAFKFLSSLIYNLNSSENIYLAILSFTAANNKNIGNWTAGIFLSAWTCYMYMY